MSRRAQMSNTSPAGLYMIAMRCRSTRAVPTPAGAGSSRCTRLRSNPSPQQGPQVAFRGDHTPHRQAAAWLSRDQVSRSSACVQKVSWEGIVFTTPALGPPVDGHYYAAADRTISPNRRRGRQRWSRLPVRPPWKPFPRRPCTHATPVPGGARTAPVGGRATPG